MLLDPPLRPKDVVQLKKKHPCGSDLWEVLLAGSDVRLKCLGCGRVVLVDRVRFNSRIKKRVRVWNQDRTEETPAGETPKN